MVCVNLLMTARQYANSFAQTDHSCNLFNYLTPWSKNIYAFKIKWWIKAFILKRRSSNLCLTENSIFKRIDELLETCRHQRKHFLVSLFNPVWHGTGHFYPYVFVWSDFVSWFFFKFLLEVRIEINRVILTKVD